MTRWNPGDGGHEVLSYGSERPPRRPPRLLVGGVLGALVGVAAGLALGLSFGVRVDAGGRSTSARPPAAEEPATDAPEVAVGAVTKLGPHADSVFLLAVYNGGDEEVTATVAALPGWMPPLSQVIPTAVRPRSWAHVSFEARPDCRVHPGTVRSVRLQVRTPDGLTDRVALLPQPADALREHHDTVCGTD